MKRSSCCDAWVYPDTDVCMMCREHCDVYDEDDEVGKRV